MEKVSIAGKLSGLVLLFVIILSSTAFASLTKEQAEDVANFATAFIEKGNLRRDEEGYPLLVYALSNNVNKSKEIRRSGYNTELYHIYNNNYHKKNGAYLDLGYKWTMDCGDFISYVYNTTLGLDMYLEEEDDPWHIKDIYNDAKKENDSEIFEFVYKDVPISMIEEEKLELGDVIVRMGAGENHGLIYVGENMQAAHASRNGIKYYKNPPILGFEVVKFDNFYRKSTIVSIVRVKDGVVPTEQRVNTTITWPDNGEIETLVPKNIVKYTHNLAESKHVANINQKNKPVTSFIQKVFMNPKALLIYVKPSEIQDQFIDWFVVGIKRFFITLMK